MSTKEAVMLSLIKKIGQLIEEEPDTTLALANGLASALALMVHPEVTFDSIDEQEAVDSIVRDAIAVTEEGLIQFATESGIIGEDATFDEAVKEQYRQIGNAFKRLRNTYS